MAACLELDQSGASIAYSYSWTNEMLVLLPATLAAVRLVPVRAAAVAALLHPVPVVGARAGAGVAVPRPPDTELPPAVAVLVPPLTPVIVSAVPVLVPAIIINLENFPSA